MSYFLIAFVACLALAPAIGYIASSFSIVSGSGAAIRWSQAPKPLLGGISMFLAILVAVLCGEVPFADHPIFSCAALFTVVGILDDIVSLTPGKKFIMQILAAIISARYFLLTPLSFAFVAEVLWIVLIVNAINLIDGLDGLAVCYATIIFLWISLLGNPHIVSYALLGVCIGFLPYNIKNAKLYLGDSGSHFLGSAIAVLTIPSEFSIIGTISSDPAYFLPLFFPLGDMVFVLATRLLRREPVWKGGTDHTAHRLARLAGEKKSVLILSAITILFTLPSLVLSPGNTSIVIATGILAGSVLSLGWLYKKTAWYFFREKIAE